MSVLIVNDVQEIHPGGSNDQTYEPLAKIELMIDHAIANGDDILLVKLDLPECGAIHPRIMRRVAGYQRRTIVKKPDEYNGAKWIVALCQKNKISLKNIRIVGFQTHKCVQSTTRGLKVLLPCCHIEVIKDACDNQGGNRWDTFPNLPGVVLLTSTESIEKCKASRENKKAS